MRRTLSSLSPVTGGFFLLALICVSEYFTGVSGSVAYVLTVLLILWFSWNNVHVRWIGIFATLLMFAGFLMIHHNTDPAIAINRALAIITIWIAVIFAIRYRKLFEAETVQKRQLQALFENATEGMIFTDFQGEIVRINPAAEKMFGYGPGELLGQKIESLMPERYVSAHVVQRTRLFGNPAVKPKGSGRELVARRKDGNEFHAEVGLSFFYERKQTYYIAFVVDISDRKKQEQIIEANVDSIKRLNAALDAKVKLRTLELETANCHLTREIGERTVIEARLIKSQQLYTAIARNFPEGIIGVIDAGMKYVLVDGQELHMIGFKGDNPVGQSVFGPDNPSLNAQAESMIDVVFRGESVSFDVDLKKGDYNISAVPLPDAQGGIREILVVMKNITRRKSAERKLVRAIEKEKELSALKSRFVTMASHEFRTPLSTMLSSVFLLQNYSGDKYEAQKKNHLERIRRSIQTLTELMNDLLSIGSLEEGHIKAAYAPVEIHGFLKDAVAELSSIKKSGQQIFLQYSGEEISLMLDRQMLTNILRNLVSNAVKYSPADATIHLNVSVDPDNLVIHVIDQGIGIPEHEQSEIFKRFYRAENVTNIQGTGLGLNIVKKYLHILKGSIDFRSKVNKGTTFTVHLPLSVAQEKPAGHLIT